MSSVVCGTHLLASMGWYVFNGILVCDRTTQEGLGSILARRSSFAPPYGDTLFAHGRQRAPDPRAGCTHAFKLSAAFVLESPPSEEFRAF